MNIEILEDKLENIVDQKYSAIIELIINAVREYPLFELNDTNLYFNEVKKLIGSGNINTDFIKKIINENPYKGNEDNIWIISSLNSLSEAFDLMELYKISFKEVINKMDSLNSL